MESMKTAVNAYQSVQLDASVLGATPYELIAKLLSKAIDSTLKAKQFMIDGNISAKGEHIKIAIAIITDGLNSSLNMEEGGDLAKKLHALYEHMAVCLLKAHAENNVALLDEVVSLLTEIKSGWDGIGDQVLASR
ncbi:MAG: flagellar export chaperone FliS [Gammaproteobacteria bacterium]|nr:flagellar export chaperone FliS [Gammaproteobacteria bacterium]